MKESIKEVNPLSFSAKDTSELCREFDTNILTGLPQSSIKNRHAIFGYNELTLPPSESIFSKLKEQFSDILVIILLLAAVISFITNLIEEKDSQKEEIPPWVEPMVIFLILIFNAVIGIYQDFNAENALKALKKLSISQASVLRDSVWQVIPSIDLVPGDIVKISTGNKVPADLRILSIDSVLFQVNQDILTGESQPISKVANTIHCENKDLSVFEMRNMLFSGTLVVQGSCLSMVVAIGDSTQIGIIEGEVLKASEEKEDSTPLRQKLNQFGDKLAKGIGILCLLIWLLNFNNFFDSNYGSWFEGALHYFKISVSLAVAAIPEGLPAVITTCLALGTRRMAARNAVVRNLTSVETLGCTNVICTDKTGTLTTNEMCAHRFCVFSEDNMGIITINDYEVGGNDYSLHGDVRSIHEQSALHNNIKLFCSCLTICNESHLIFKDEKKGKIGVLGLPMEGALRVLVEKIGRYLVKEQSHSFYEKENELEVFNRVFCKDFSDFKTVEFTSERKMMSVICKESEINPSRIIFTKGAPEVLLAHSEWLLNKNDEPTPLTPEKKNVISQKIQEYSLMGLRCLGIAYRKLGKGNEENPFDLQETQKNYDVNFEESFVFLGLVGMEDPPRPEVKESIEICRKAGIHIIMATGDLKETAQNIALHLNLVKESDLALCCYNGKEFEKMNPSDQEELLCDFLKSPSSSLIFYRLEPKHKRLLVSLLSKQKQIVAMTGDGVNDAPALRQADIGVAMGLSGTEVAKEASDMVLADDNFGTIVKAIEEGRAIFDNMKAFIRYMISSNIGEVVSIFLCSVLGIPDIFSSVQLLWVNLVTDGLPAMALSFNKPDHDIMSREPRTRGDGLVNRWIFIRYVVIGTYVGLATVGVFVYWYLYYDWADDNHTLISFYQLNHWSQCSNWQDFAVFPIENLDFGSKNCGYFTLGKKKASTLGLTVLVTIEMFNALNALSENNSLLVVGIFNNIWLMAAVIMSMIMHAFIIYIPGLQLIFQTSYLNINDWMLVVGFSYPVIIIDEFMKYLARKCDLARERSSFYDKKD